jgi:hypothetical protein
MAAFRQRTTLNGMRVIALHSNLVEMKCAFCELTYFAPLGQEDAIQCEAPGCLKKRQA